jgi:uncharacterized protein HemX
MEPTQMPETSAPVTPVTPTLPKPKSSLGTIAGLVIVVAAIVGGAFFFLHQRFDTDTNGEESDVSALQQQGTSTSPDAIQADLSAQSPDTFDKDVDTAIGELDASLDTSAK